jgi:gliding motility-associated-like protein
MVALYDCTNHNYKCNAGGNKKMCAGESVVLGTDDDSRRQYRWSPAVGLSDSTAAKPLASPTETTTYYLYVIDEFVQESYDTVTVEVIYCDIFIPNIFSPNGDGQNDVLYVRGQGIEQLSFVVYNRWGQKVFETKDPNHGWDGTINGKPAETGVYVYHVNAVLHDGLVVSRHGDVTLVR